MFAHVPGLSVIMPASPADAKGLLMTALSSESPVICLEHRWLYDKSGPVPEEPYYTPFGVGAVARPGRDVTIVAVSHMVLEALQAAEALAAEGIEAEVIDPRTLRPLDSALICRSAARTGRLVIADTGWRSYGVSAEIAARAAEELWGVLKAPIKRVALPEVPTPASSILESAYYPGPREIVAAVKQCLEAPAGAGPDRVAPSNQKEFEGPF
jgi:pyruvate dehydrogenase E1 component beta subunit